MRLAVSSPLRVTFYILRADMSRGGSRSLCIVSTRSGKLLSLVCFPYTELSIMKLLSLLIPDSVHKVHHVAKCRCQCPMNNGRRGLFYSPRKGMIAKPISSRNLSSLVWYCNGPLPPLALPKPLPPKHRRQIMESSDTQ